MQPGKGEREKKERTAGPILYAIAYMKAEY